MCSGRVIIYYHATCPTSIKLINLLKKEGLLDSVKLIDVKDNPFIALNNGILSVPAIEINGEIIDFGPIDFDYVLNRIRGNNAVYELSDKVNTLKRIILDNLFLSLVLYLHEKLEPLLDYYLIRKRLGWENKELHEIKSELRLSNESFYRVIEEKLLKVIAINLLREIKWLNQIELTKRNFLDRYDVDTLSHWLIARGSVARVNLIVPDEKLKVRSKAIKLLNFIKDNWSYLIQKV